MLQNFLAELKRRGVSRTAAIYAASAWGLLQVADIVFPLLRLPDWSLTLLLLVAAAGFPVILCASWFYDFSPHGITLTEEIEEQGFRPVSNWRMVEFGLILLLVVTVGVLFLDRLTLEAEHAEALQQSTASPPEAGAKSIAVLPFINMSERAEDAYFGDGLSEEILNLLARVQDLQVAARTSSFRHRGDNADAREIGQALSVRYILEGSVRRQGDHIRVTAQFVDAVSGYHLWSQNFDREMRDVFSIQDDIAMRVVNSLQLILDPQAENALSQPPTENTGAYQAYLQGRDYLRKERSPQNLEQAIELFEHALALDPAFAQAYAGLCDGYLMDYIERRDTSLFEAAEKNCHRALTLDDSAPAVYVALGNLYIASGQAERAKNEFDRAIALSPNLIGAHVGLARTLETAELYEQALLAYQRVIDMAPNEPVSHWRIASFYFRNGEPEKAIQEYTRAADLDPGNAEIANSLGAAWYLLGDYERAAQAWTRSLALRPTALAYSNTGTSYYYLGRFNEAIDMYRGALALTPADYELWGAVGDCYRAMGDSSEAARDFYRKAIELAGEALRINPGSADIAALLAHYHAGLGDTEAALALIAKADAAQGSSMYVHYDLALAYAALGESQAALAELQRAIEAGYPTGLLSVDPGFASLRGISRYQALVENPIAGG